MIVDMDARPLQKADFARADAGRDPA